MGWWVMPDDYSRGRTGRPWVRIKNMVKREGTHVCWLCGKPIDMTLHHTARMSWTLDHALPLKDYPELWDEPSNLREAHRSCNSSKGARSTWGRPTNSRAW